MSSPYQPVYEFTRGQTVESIHYGAIAIVDVSGKLVASYGDASVVTFLRSTAKPFQVMPFLIHDGQNVFDLTDREIAIMCASHSGTDEHVAVVQAIQEKAGISESELLCGTHFPYDAATAKRLREQKEEPSPNRHNCSGKHSGMLAFTRLLSEQSETYIDINHPIQKEIVENFAEMCNLSVEEVQMGIDGCSAPNFAAPIYHSALAFARLCDPVNGKVSTEKRISACRTVVRAMIANPDMVAGPGRFDTRLMELSKGKIVSKAGAEGFQGIGLLPGALDEGSPAFGIAIKISDGDARGTVRSAVALEVLWQLGMLAEADLEGLGDIGPRLKVFNWRKIEVGQGYPVFDLNK